MDAVLPETQFAGAQFANAQFADFGDDALYPFPRTGLQSVESDETQELRAHVRRFAPRAPGVYGMVDPLNRLVYVGKSKSLRGRLLSYFMPNNEEDKAGRIVQSTQSIVWETQPSDFAALLREQHLIRQFQPRFNVQGMPRRQQPVYLCLGRAPAEQLYTARRPDAKALYQIGPLTGAARAARAVEVLNRIYGLRDCSTKQQCSFTDQLQLFDIGLRPGCIRLEIRSCLGPCISACSKKDYGDQVAKARSFLAGESDQPITELTEQMQRASQNLHFEQATVLREDLAAVGWLHRRAMDLATARASYTFIYPVPADSNSKYSREIWYLIRRGMMEGAVSAPTDHAERRSIHRTLCHWLESENCVGVDYVPRHYTLALISSWFRKHPSELRRTFLPSESLRSLPRLGTMQRKRRRKSTSNKKLSSA